MYREKAGGAKTDPLEPANLLRVLEPGDVVIVTRPDRLARGGPSARHERVETQRLFEGTQVATPGCAIVTTPLSSQASPSGLTGSRDDGSARAVSQLLETEPAPAFLRCRIFGRKTGFHFS